MKIDDKLTTAESQARITLWARVEVVPFRDRLILHLARVANISDNGTTLTYVHGVTGRHGCLANT